MWECDCESGWFKVARIGKKKPKRLRLKRVTTLGSVPVAMFEVRPSTFDVGCSVPLLWAYGIRTSTIILGPQGYFLSKIQDYRFTALHLIRKPTFHIKKKKKKEKKENPHFILMVFFSLFLG